MDALSHQSTDDEGTGDALRQATAGGEEEGSSVALGGDGKLADADDGDMEADLFRSSRM